MIKKIISILLLIVCCAACNNSSEEIINGIVYFRFSGCAEEAYDNWRDTSFIAATADPRVIAQCRSQLKLSREMRSKFPLGTIESGLNGYNFNHTHQFSWQFKPGEWELVDVGIEIYDGCPYSDAEQSDYLNTYGRYGGWGNVILEELH